MGDVLGLGMTHYPLLSAPDEHLSSILRYTLEDPEIPAALRDPANWPEHMRTEWAADQGRAAATPYRAALLRGLREVRRALDAFAPDAVVIWGDDQYENFREDVIPAFCVFAYDDLEIRPFAKISAESLKGRPNVWGETAETTRRVHGNRDIAKALVTGLLDESFDVAYAYRPLHYDGLAHAFLNAVLYLDYDRGGFPYPVIPMTINCYGRRVISHKGTFRRLDATRPLDPPSPSPRRCFDLGRAIARVARASPYRIALIASSSWSHAFLVDKTWRLQPDVASDRRLYDWFTNGSLARWRDVTLSEIEDAGQQELLNWFPLAGAMHELGAHLAWSEIVETYVYTSTKVSAIFEPVRVSG
jgi:Catalytic LigB subunit of aromatic ring-opening dioxygenase